MIGSLQSLADGAGLLAQAACLGPCAVRRMPWLGGDNCRGVVRRTSHVGWQEIAAEAALRRPTHRRGVSAVTPRGDRPQGRPPLLPLIDCGAEGDGWCQALVVQPGVGHGADGRLTQPLDNCGALVCVPVSSDYGVFHDLAGDWAYKDGRGSALGGRGHGRRAMTCAGADPGSPEVAGAVLTLWAVHAGQA
eukprot:scaffold171839_cov44-Prasinocladus_malaysianus.AAC.1